MADSLPQNPFRPGAGRPPAHMGRRPEVERPLLEVLTGLRTGEADNYLVYLYGPRGNGKTVLLGWLRERANREGGGAIRATSAARRQYCAHRYDEFLRVGALPLAKDVALAFRRSAAPMTNADINRLLARHAGNPAELRSLLNAVGYVWRDDDDRWTPGIPSLMDYVIEETALEPDRRESAP